MTKTASPTATVPSEDVRRLFSSAVQALADGEPLRAQGLLAAMLLEAPDHPMALHLSGVVALQQNKRSEALQQIEK